MAPNIYLVFEVPLQWASGGSPLLMSPLPKGTIPHSRINPNGITPHRAFWVHIPPIQTWKTNDKCGNGWLRGTEKQSYSSLANYFRKLLSKCRWSPWEDAINAIGRPMLPDARFAVHNSPPTNTAVRSPTFPRSSAASSAGPCLVQRTGSRGRFSPAWMAIHLLLNNLTAWCFSVAPYAPSSSDARSSLFPKCPHYNSW